MGTEGNINVIPNNEERYISFSKEVIVGSYTKKKQKHNITRELRFIDSCRFMLDTLVQNLEQNQFKNMKQFYEGEKLNLLLKKGVYPYDYMSDKKNSQKRSFQQKKNFIQN